jgi:hypothetical protein
MRRLLLGLGSLALAGMALFPPWQATFRYDEKTVGPIPSGYHFVLRSRTEAKVVVVYSVDVSQLAVQMSVIVFVVAGIALIIPREEREGPKNDVVSVRSRI